MKHNTVKTQLSFAQVRVNGVGVTVVVTSAGVTVGVHC